MIANKNQLKKALKERKDNIKFKTIVNEIRNDRQLGILRNVGTKIQTNAFTIETNTEEKGLIDSWVWYDNIDVSNNIIKFKEKFGNIQIEIVEV